MVPAERMHRSVSGLAFAALGVVYGDIGTSPLYAAKETFNHTHGIPFNAESIIGGVSAIFWALMIVVSLKYVVLIMRADNKGEGGIMALLSLVSTSVKGHTSWARPLAILGVFGAALFYGDGVITPAISVLSAIEGLEVATPLLKPYVVALTVVVLIALYSVQSRGTGGIGKWFGPVMTIWFLVLAGMGVVNIMKAPQILAAVNPWYAFAFLDHNRLIAFIALG